MGNQVWLWRVMVTAVALAGGGASISTRAQASSLGNGYHAAPGVAHEDSSIDSANPTDDGSIVIECVAWGGTRDGAPGEHAAAPSRAHEVLAEGTQADSVGPPPRTSLPQM
jgi:hypothetical protein